MVGFASHTFEFDASKAQRTFRLLNKYYPGIGVGIVVDGTKHTGKISEEFLSSLPQGQNYTVVTERFWNGLACVKTLPVFEITSTVVNDEKIWKLRRSIDELIGKRLMHGGQEIFLSKLIEYDDFADVKLAVSMIKLGNVTRMYSGPDYIILVLEERYPIRISNYTVCDGNLPIFDLDDGYCTSEFGMTKDLCKDLNVSFRAWMDRLEQTNGESWNEPILTNKE